MVASQARPAYIFDQALNDWVPMSGVVDTGRSYTFSANQTFDGLVTANNGINATSTLNLQTGGVNRMSIDSSGYLSMPNKPIISGQMGTISTIIGAQLIGFDQFWVSRGISYNSTTKRFTVPVAGIYRVTFNPFVNSGYGGTRVQIGVNTDSPGASSHYGHAYAGDSSYQIMCLDSIINLSANDYIVFYLSAGSLYTASSDRFNQFSIEMIA